MYVAVTWDLLMQSPRALDRLIVVHEVKIIAQTLAVSLRIYGRQDGGSNTSSSAVFRHQSKYVFALHSEVVLVSNPLVALYRQMQSICILISNALPTGDTSHSAFLVLQIVAYCGKTRLVEQVEG